MFLPVNLRYLLYTFRPVWKTGLRQGLQPALRDTGRRTLALAAVVDFTQRAQPIGGDFRCQITLGRSQHFKSDHEFWDSRRPQQRRIVMRVKMPFVVYLA